MIGYLINDQIKNVSILLLSHFSQQFGNGSRVETYGKAICLIGAKVKSEISICAEQAHNGTHLLRGLAY